MSANRRIVQNLEDLGRPLDVPEGFEVFEIDTGTTWMRLDGEWHEVGYP